MRRPASWPSPPMTRRPVSNITRSDLPAARHPIAGAGPSHVQARRAVAAAVSSGSGVQHAASGRPDARTKSPYLRAGATLALRCCCPAARQGQRWLCDAVPAASRAQRCGKRPATPQQQRANDAVTVGSTGLMPGSEPQSRPRPPSVAGIALCALREGRPNEKRPAPTGGRAVSQTLKPVSPDSPAGPGTWTGAGAWTWSWTRSA